MKRGTTPQTIDNRALKLARTRPILDPLAAVSAEGAGLEPDPVVSQAERLSIV